MRRLIAGAMLGMVLGVAAPARADITGFLGLSPTPDNRLAKGIAAGFGFVVVGFEGEYSRINEDTSEGLPSLTTGMANVMVQTPIAVSGMQFYGTTGLGLYRERLGSATETALAGNIGGGVKIRLAGPLKLRLDYRLFRLRGEPAHDVYHRVYAGATLGF